MKSSFCFIAALAVFGVSLLCWTNTDAQVVRRGVGVGGSISRVSLGAGSETQSLIRTLFDDDQWSDAHAKLLVRASKGNVVEVAYHLNKAKSWSKKVAPRVEAVMNSLREQGLYPLKAEQISETAEKLSTLLGKLDSKKVSEEARTSLLMALEQAEAKIKKALVIQETGEEPKSPSTSASGGFRRVRGG